MSIFRPRPRFRFFQAHFLRILFVAGGLALLLCISALPVQAARQADNPLSLQVNYGFDAAYRSESWTPVYVTVDNSGPRVDGTLIVSIYTGPPNSSVIGSVSPWSFQQHVTITPNGHQRFTFYLPFTMGNLNPTGVLATLKDAKGRTLATQTGTTGYAVPPGDLLVGWLSDLNPNQAPLYSMLVKVNLINQSSSLTSSNLTAATFPTQVAVLENFDVMVLDDFASNTLSRQQWQALQIWVNQGGLLIEVGGAQWQRTLGSVPTSLLPVTPNTTQTLPAGTRLLPITGESGQKVAFNQPVTATGASLRKQDGTFSNNSVMLSNGSTPLIVQSRQGQGTICYVAFDLADTPILVWPGISDLWKVLLQSTLGDRLLISNTVLGYPSGPGHLLAHGGVLALTEVATPFNFWIVGILLLGYVLSIGPIRYLLMKRYHWPRGWDWRILFACALVFSLLGYSIAAFQHRGALADNSVSLIRFNQGNAATTQIHTTTYRGIFVPDQGDISMNFSGNSLVQPLAGATLARSSAAFALNPLPATVEAQGGGTKIQLRDLASWSFHPVIQEQDQQIQGGLTTHLALHNDTIEGTVTNNLSTALNDVYVLLPHQFVHIAHLAVGETQTVKLTLANHNITGPLADAIAHQGGLPVPYSPYGNGQHPQTDFQRHAALLSFLNGADFNFQPCQGSCVTRAITATPRATIFATGGNVPHNSIYNDYDPLLLSGAQATLIGWTEQPLQDDTTINGSHPAGQHESFIQAPLSVDTSASAQVPTGFIPSQVVDIQSHRVQTVLPGLYSLLEGSVTFEMQAPVARNASHYFMIQPDLALQPDSQGRVTTGVPSNLRTSLYNWQKGNWEPVSFGQQGATITNPATYTDPNGRILVQISSQNSTPAYFSRPLLAINT